MAKGLSEDKVVMFLLRVGVELRGNRSGYSLTGPKYNTAEITSGLRPTERGACGEPATSHEKTSGLVSLQHCRSRDLPC